MSDNRTVEVIGNNVKIEDLLASQSELTILHNSQQYKLRLTSNNKLILTK